jgi:hypothetical protein
MPSAAPGAGSGTRRSKLKGCLIAAAIAVGVCLVLVGIVLGVLYWQFRSLRSDFTGTELTPVPVAQVDAETAKRLARTVEQFARALKDGRPGQFAFTGTQINQLIAALPAAAELRGRASFAIDGGRLKVRGGIPLEEVPGFQGRYLNGEFALEVRADNGQLHVYVVDISVRGKSLPNVLLDRLRTENLADRFLRDPEARRLCGNLKAVRVADGTLQVETGR